jgi:hypothetical protein
VYFGFELFAKGGLPEQEGFEPPVPFGTTVFKTVALNHSATAPSPGNPLFNNIGPNAESGANFQPFYNQTPVFQANLGLNLSSCGLSMFAHREQKMKNFQNFA